MKEKVFKTFPLMILVVENCFDSFLFFGIDFFSPFVFLLSEMILFSHETTLE